MDRRSLAARQSIYAARRRCCWRLRCLARCADILRREEERKTHRGALPVNAHAVRMVDVEIGKAFRPVRNLPIAKVCRLRAAALTATRIAKRWLPKRNASCTRPGFAQLAFRGIPDRLKHEPKPLPRPSCPPQEPEPHRHRLWAQR